MIKKITSVTISMLLIMVIVLPVINSINTNTSIELVTRITYDHNFNKYDESHSQLNGVVFPRCIVMNNLFIDLDPNSASPKPTIIDTPDYFNWKDWNGRDWTTIAKYQGNCESCWDFAAMGCLESILSIRENCSKLDPDLSEQYVLSCLKGAGSCRGGLARSAFRYINLTDRRGNYCNGVVLESCMPYQADDDIECINKCDNWEEKLVPIIDYGYWYPDGSENDRDIIKTQIKDHGPVVATMLFTFL